MGSVRNNKAKWYDFKDDEKLYADDSQGLSNQNLDVHLQQNIANDLDNIVKDTVGDAVTNVGYFRVDPVEGAMSLLVTAGSAYINGQRVRMTTDYTITSVPANTADQKVYLSLDDANQVFDTTLISWPLKIELLAGAATPPTNSILLATVNTTSVSTGPIPSANITDARVISYTGENLTAAVADTITPADSARSTWHRLGMFATRFKDIVGGSGWKDSVPISLTALLAKFDGSSGHTHAGTSADGPKISASNVVFAPGSSGLTSTDTNSAVTEVSSKKLSLAGGTMTGALNILEPSASTHAATKAYVDSKIMSQVHEVELTDLTANNTSYESIFSAPKTITATGNIVKFEAPQQKFTLSHTTTDQAVPTGSSSISFDMLVELHRDSVRVASVVITFDSDENPHTLNAVGSEYHLTAEFPIPVFYDKPTAGSHTYDVKVKTVGGSGSGGVVGTSSSVEFKTSWQSTNKPTTYAYLIDG